MHKPPSTNAGTVVSVRGDAVAGSPGQSHRRAWQNIPETNNQTHTHQTMKKLQILGTGCAKCNALTDVARNAADALGVPYELEKITDMLRFVDFGVMITPALVVDGTVKVSGRVPSLEEAKSMIGGQP